MSQHKISDVGRLKTDDKWSCPLCSFNNLALLDSCEMCETKKPKQLMDLSYKQNQKSKTIVCPNSKCKAQNSIDEIKCKKCNKFLIDQLNEDDQEDIKIIKGEKQKPKAQLIKCHKCSFQNDSENTHCLSCDVKIKNKHILRKPKIKAPRYGRGANYCEDCNSYKTYNANGQFECQCPEIDDGLPIEKNFCNFCFQKLQKGKYDEHIQNCKQKQIFYDPNKNKSFERMTKLQVDTIIYMHNKSMKLHFQRQKKLEQRIQKLGFKKQQLQNLYHYIVNYAPIIIHMHANTHMEFFVKDTNYRSQFQTAKSSGSLSRSARTGWQDRMFDNLHHDAQDSQRVKYGTMNFTNDPHGVNACVGYGQSYFLLKEHVRDRCTMTDMDSSSSNATICTFRFCYHLLCKLSDAQIKAAFEGSKAQQVKSTVIGMYKQIQIHGPVQFKKDIQRVYISQQQLNLNPKALDLIKQFCKKNDLEYEIFEKPGIAPIMGGGLFAPSIAPKVGFGGGMFGGVSVGAGFGGGFGGAHYPVVRPAYIPPIGPPIRFPYSMPPRKQQKQGQDYI